MNELIAFCFGGIVVYLATYQHVRFLEKELLDLRGALFHRVGYQPKETKRLWPWQKPELMEPVGPKKKEEVHDLLSMQEELRNS